MRERKRMRGWEGKLFRKKSDQRHKGERRKDFNKKFNLCSFKNQIGTVNYVDGACET